MHCCTTVLRCSGLHALRLRLRGSTHSVLTDSLALDPFPLSPPSNQILASPTATDPVPSSQREATHKRDAEGGCTEKEKNGIKKGQMSERDCSITRETFRGGWVVSAVRASCLLCLPSPYRTYPANARRNPRHY